MAGGHLGFGRPEFSTVSECIFRSNMGIWGLLRGPHLQNLDVRSASYPTIYFLCHCMMILVGKFVCINFYGTLYESSADSRACNCKM